MAAIGIDIGTTNCCSAVWQEDHLGIIVNSSTPSFIFKDGKIVLLGDDNANIKGSTIIGVKTLVDSNPIPIIEADGKREEMLAILYKKASQRPDLSPPSLEHKAVITVPAAFDSFQRQAILDAAKIAGINVLRVRNQSTAAALAYFSANKDVSSSTLFVFCLGGGNLELSVVRKCRNLLQVKGNYSDNSISGMDFHTNLIPYCIDQLNRQHHIGLGNDEAILHRLKMACENAKICLSSSERVEIDIPALLPSVNFKTSVTRLQFEQLNKEMFKRCLQAVALCLKASKMKKSSIDEILLTGGSTLIPKLRESVYSFFHREKDILSTRSLDKELVLKGVSLEAEMLVKESHELVVEEVTSVPFQALVKPGATSVLHMVVQKNSIYPSSSRTHRFSTTTNSQPAISIEIFETQKKKIKPYYPTKTCVAKSWLSGLPQAPKGVYQISVSYHIDPNGIFRLLETGHETKQKPSLEGQNITHHTIPITGLSAEDKRKKKAQLDLKFYLEWCKLKINDFTNRFMADETEKVRLGIQDWFDRNDLGSETHLFLSKYKELRYHMASSSLDDYIAYFLNTNEYYKLNSCEKKQVTDVVEQANNVKLMCTTEPEALEAKRKELELTFECVCKKATLKEQLASLEAVFDQVNVNHLVTDTSIENLITDVKALVTNNSLAEAEVYTTKACHLEQVSFSILAKTALAEKAQCLGNVIENMDCVVFLHNEEKRLREAEVEIVDLLRSNLLIGVEEVVPAKRFQDMKMELMSIYKTILAKCKLDNYRKKLSSSIKHQTFTGKSAIMEAAKRGAHVLNSDEQIPTVFEDILIELEEICNGHISDHSFPAEKHQILTDMIIKLLTDITSPGSN